MKKVIIAGCRNFNNYSVAEIFIDECIKNENVVIISGGCKGADRLGEIYAQKHGIEIIKFPAEWSRYGKAAGPIRNRKMAEDADIIICFWDKKSRGTKSLIDYAEKLNKKVYVKYIGF